MQKTTTEVVTAYIPKWDGSRLCRYDNHDDSHDDDSKQPKYEAKDFPVSVSASTVRHHIACLDPGLIII